MKKPRVDIEDFNNEMVRLKEIAKGPTDKVILKNMTQMFNRSGRTAATTEGGTPFETGELRLSRRISENTFGYTAEYAPHVEYGHRTKKGGYVQGQHFLFKNTNLQQQIFYKDIDKLLRRG